MMKSGSFFNAVMILVLCLGLGSTALPAALPDSQVIKQQAQACGDAMLNNDFGAIADFTHPKILARIGGKAPMIERLKKGLEEMKAQGASYESVVMGAPFNFQVTADGTQTAEVPQHMVLKVRGGHLTKDSYLLGVNPKNSRAWFFIDLGKMSTAQFIVAFPEYGDCVELRPQKTPVFTPDK